jgi:hypothetical protein
VNTGFLDNYFTLGGFLGVKKLLRAFLAMLIFPLSSSGLAQTPNLDLLKLNRHAQLELKDYPTIYWRDIGTYTSMLGDAFADKVSRLEPDDFVLDGGAGLGVALLPMIDQKGVHGYAINGTDMMKQVLILAAQIEKNPTMVEFEPSTYPKGSKSREGIRCLLRVKKIGPFFRLRPEFDFPLTGIFEGVGLTDIAVPFECIDSPDSQKIAKSLRLLELTLNQSPYNDHFHYVAQYVEKVITRPPFISAELPPKGNVELITDVYGAFLYSAERAQLLEMYYNALTATGRGYVVGLFVADQKDKENNFSEWLELSQVRNRHQSLLEFLLNCFGDKFSITYIHLPNPKEPGIDSDLKMRIINLHRTSDKPLSLGLKPILNEGLGQYLETPASVDNGFPILHYDATICPGEQK